MQLLKPDQAQAAFLEPKESSRSCRPDDSLTALIEGNSRFAAAWQAKNKESSLNERAQVMSNLWLDNCFLPASVLENSQSPWASIISCADSRVAPEWIFDAAAGDLFVVRSAGNTPFDEGIASLEFGVGVLKTPLIMVLGHSNCGAVQAARATDSLSPLFDQLIMPIRANLVPGEAPERPRGAQDGGKRGPRGAQGRPKGDQREAKGSPKAAQTEAHEPKREASGGSGGAEDEKRDF